jgi:hypothetical protein
VNTGIAVRATLVTVPSSPVGEGCSAIQQRLMGGGFASQNAFDEEAPSPNHDSLINLHALSRKGRGRNNARRMP